MGEAKIHNQIKNWKQLMVLAGLAFVVPVLLILALVQIVTGGMRVDTSSPDMSEEAIAARIKPIGELNLALGRAAEEPPAATPAPPGGTSSPPPAPAGVATATPSTAARSGQEVYQQACAMCHGPGVAGAPRAGDKGAWQPRIAQGKAMLYEHAIKGFRAMPPKGGNAGLSDAEVKAAVDHLAATSK